MDDRVPDETLGVLAAACGARSVELVRIDARRFDFSARGALTAGDMLFRPAVSLAAIRVEEALYADGVATFHADADAVFRPAVGTPRFLERSGVPVPRTLPCTTTDRSRLRRYVEFLGGLPVVVKVLGGEGGVGVLRADSLPALFSLVDFLVAEGRLPHLLAYVADAVHWRVIVVGGATPVAYENPVARDDFRSVATADPSKVTEDVAADLSEVALRAAASLRTELAGVDVLRHPSGRLYVLEANSPCYFAHAQRIAGTDVAGCMLDHLLAKRRRLMAR
mgnify:FL=1